MDNQEEYLKKLEERIKNARRDSEDHGNIEKPKTKEEENPEALRSGRAGTHFLSNIIAGWLFGVALDWFFGTRPWGMISFMILGLISGTYRANQIIQKKRP